jgi:hypothetical protein
MNATNAPAAAELDTTIAMGLDQLVVRVQGKLNGRIHDLRLSIRGYGIVLQGFARTYHAKQLAQHTLMRETALPIAANEIEVF